MTENQIKQLCPQADRISITPDGTIGIKVGEFAQAINVNFNTNHEAAERQIKDLYLDLLGMNRSMQRQIKQADDDYKRKTSAN